MKTQMTLFFYYLKVLSVFAACLQILPGEGLHTVEHVFLIKRENDWTRILPQHDADELLHQTSCLSENRLLKVQ